MRIRGLCHLAQAQVQPFREQDVEQADPVAACNSGSQMGEGVGDAERGIDLEQDVGDPHGRHSTIEIQYQLFSVVGNVRRQSVDPQGAIFYAAVGDGSVAGCPGEPLQSVGQPHLAIRQPALASQPCGSIGTANLTFSCAVFIGTSTCLRSP